jgi:hypothetical protein
MKFLVDENFDNTIVRGLLRRKSGLDVVRVQDVGLAGADDPAVLEWAAQAGRILLTHDVATITRYAYERLADSLRMSGVIEVAWDTPIGKIIDDLLLIEDCGVEGEFEGQIVYLPF